MTVSLTPIPVDTVRPGQVRDAFSDTIQVLNQYYSLYCVNPKKDFSCRCVFSYDDSRHTWLCYQHYGG